MFLTNRGEKAGSWAFYLESFEYEESGGGLRTGSPEGPAGLLQADVPVRNADRIRSGVKMLIESLGKDDGAVCTAGAADGNDQPAFSLTLIQRKEIVDHGEQMGEERFCFLFAQDIVPNRFLQSGIGTDVLNIIRIGKEADVEDEITFLWNAALEAERHDFNT